MNRVLAVLAKNTNNAMGKSISSKQIEVAVGIVANPSGQLLVAKRPEHWIGAGYWEFPGGKLEPGEDPAAALQRELLEEVGIIVNDYSPLIQLAYVYPERKVIIYAFRVHSYSGEAKGLEGQEISWQPSSSLNQLNMLEANRAIVVATQLPDIYWSVTPNQTDLFTHSDAQLLRFHLVNTSRENSLSSTKQWIEECHKHSAIALLNSSNLQLAEESGAAGVHLSSQNLFEYVERPLPKQMWLSASVHNLEQLHKAEEVGVDFVTIGPVSDMGWDKFASLVAEANIPVFAEGGVTKTDLVKVKEYGGHGVVLEVSELNR